MGPVENASVVRRRVVVEGRVQGVGFRLQCAREANRAGASGFVINRDDGQVEAEIQGSAAVVDILVSWCRSGPPGASVSAVHVTDLAPIEERDDFRVLG